MCTLNVWLTVDTTPQELNVAKKHGNLAKRFPRSRIYGLLLMLLFDMYIQFYADIHLSKCNYHCGFIFAFYFIFFGVCDARKLLTDVHTEMLRFCSASLCWRWHWRFCGCSLGCRSKQQRRNPARGGQHMGHYNHTTPSFLFCHAEAFWSYVETHRRISIIGLICLDNTSSVLWWWSSFSQKTYDI